MINPDEYTQMVLEYAEQTAAVPHTTEHVVAGLALVAAGIAALLQQNNKSTEKENGDETV